MYTRELSQTILGSFNTRDIIFLLGTRQTGKTTLSHLLAKESDYTQEHTHYYDLEDKGHRELFNTATLASLEQIFRLEGIDVSVPQLIIFDEVQLLSDPANLVKLLHDHFPTLKIIATGSSSLQIKSKFSDSLAGRKRVYLVEPLSFDEFLLFRGEEKLLRLRTILREEGFNTTLEKLIKASHSYYLAIFEEYLIYGGYPEVVLIDKREDKLQKLDSIASSYIQKDIREIANIENLSAYNNLLKYLSVNAGNQFNLSSAQETVGVSSVTLNRYLTLLQETFIIAELPPFFTNRNKEISKSKKYFYKDSGINNLFLQNFNSLDIRSDAGSLYETYVFNTLVRGQDITRSTYFYRTQSKSEVDFIQVQDAEYTLLEVKAGKHQRIPRAMTEFEKKYQDQCKITNKTIINKSVYEQRDGVTFLPAYCLVV